uniref:Secreted protein n=1 Tax=Acrobeloides nanus TaxID=290746 RepID=A0A914BYK3_9BILA
MPSSMLASMIRHSSSMLNISLAACSLLSTSSWAVFIALRFFKVFYSLPYGRLMYTKKSTNLTFLNTALMHSDNSWSKFFHAY